MATYTIKKRPDGSYSDNQTAESVRQLKALKNIQQQLGPKHAYTMNDEIMSLLLGNPQEAEADKLSAKSLEEQMRNLQLSQMYGGMGDIATQKYYGKASLPENIKSLIPKKREPQMIERLMAMFGQKDIGSGINAWESPASYGVMKTSPEQGDLDYLIRSMLGSQQQLQQGDITNLRNLYEPNQNYNDIYNSLP